MQKKFQHQVRLLPKVLAIFKLPKVSLEPLLRNADVGTFNTAFNASPEGFDVVRVREIRDWFWEIDDSDLGWEEFGEALHAATMGDALGFRLWVAWVKARHPHVSDLAHQLVLWRSFGRPEEPETLELVVVGATDFKTS